VRVAIKRQQSVHASQYDECLNSRVSRPQRTELALAKNRCVGIVTCSDASEQFLHAPSSTEASGFRLGLSGGLAIVPHLLDGLPSKLATITFLGLGRGGAGDAFLAGLEIGLAIARLRARACSLRSSSPFQSLVNSARTPWLHCRTTSSNDDQVLSLSMAFATAMTSSLSRSSHLNSAAFNQYRTLSARRFGFVTSS